MDPTNYSKPLFLYGNISNSKSDETSSEVHEENDVEFINGDVEKAYVEESVITINHNFNAPTAPVIYIPSILTTPLESCSPNEPKINSLNVKKKGTEHIISTAKINETIDYPRPSLTIPCLIALALKNSPTGCLNIAEIYKFMRYHFPYFNTVSHNWKSSVRYCLSSSMIFKRIETTDRTRCGLWTINSDKVKQIEMKVDFINRKDSLNVKKAMYEPENWELMISGELKNDFDNCSHNEESYTIQISEEEPESNSSMEFSDLSHDFVMSSESYKTTSEIECDEDVKIEVKEEWLAIEDLSETESSLASTKYNDCEGDQKLSTSSSSTTTAMTPASPTTPLVFLAHPSNLQKNCHAVPSNKDKIRLEKMRRRDLGNSLNNLKVLIPLLWGQDACSKAEILSGAIEYIRELRNLEKRFVKEELTLKCKNDSLLATLAELDTKEQ